MSVRYKKVQNKLEDSKSYLKWYGRAVTLGTVDTVALAEELSHSTTVTRADIMAVLVELAEAMRRHLLASQAVSLDGIGSFRVGINSVGADTKDDFKASNIKSFRIVYNPVRASIASYTDADGKPHKVYVKTLLNGVTAEELPDNGNGTATTSGDSSTGGDGSSTGDGSQNNG